MADKRIFLLILIIGVVMFFYLDNQETKDYFEENPDLEPTQTKMPEERKVTFINPIVEDVNIPSPPEIQVVAPPVVGGGAPICKGTSVNIMSDVNNGLFENCKVKIGAHNIDIVNSRFTNSHIEIINKYNTEIKDSIIENYYKNYGKALLVVDSVNTTVDHCLFRGNANAIWLEGANETTIKRSEFRENDAQGAIYSKEDSILYIENNYFIHNHPNAILIKNDNDEDCAEGVYSQFSIKNNIIENTVEDGIEIQVFKRSSEISRITNNLIRNSGWSGIFVGYNSWNASIVIDNNYISDNGNSVRDTTLYPKHNHQAVPYTDGEGHGIKLEDTSNVYVRTNNILNNRDNGVDVQNAVEIEIKNNFIYGNAIGLKVAGPDSNSFARDYERAEQSHYYSTQVENYQNTFSNNNLATDVEEGSELTTAMVFIDKIMNVNIVGWIINI